MDSEARANNVKTLFRDARAVGPAFESLVLNSSPVSSDDASRTPCRQWRNSKLFRYSLSFLPVSRCPLSSSSGRVCVSMPPCLSPSLSVSGRVEAVFVHVSMVYAILLVAASSNYF